MQQVLPVYLTSQDQQELLALPVHKEFKELQVRKVVKVLQVLLAIMALPALLVLKGKQVQRDLLDK